MRTKEFIKRVEELGFETSTHESTIVLYNKGNEIAFVYRRLYMKFKNSYADWDYLSIGDKKNLFGLIVEYVSTPVDEREEPKKYYLRHRWLGVKDDEWNYLNCLLSDSDYYLNSHEDTGNIKTQFTRENIEEIKEKYNTDLSDFDIVEVEE